MNPYLYLKTYASELQHSLVYSSKTGEFVKISQAQYTVIKIKKHLLEKHYHFFVVKNFQQKNDDVFFS